MRAILYKVAIMEHYFRGFMPMAAHDLAADWCSGRNSSSFRRSCQSELL